MAWVCHIHRGQMISEKSHLNGKLSSCPITSWSMRHNYFMTSSHDIINLLLNLLRQTLVKYNKYVCVWEGGCSRCRKKMISEIDIKLFYCDGLINLVHSTACTYIHLLV